MGASTWGRWLRDVDYLKYLFEIAFVDLASILLITRADGRPVEQREELRTLLLVDAS